jgi:hypothetical protein
MLWFIVMRLGILTAVNFYLVSLNTYIFFRIQGIKGFRHLNPFVSGSKQYAYTKHQAISVKIIGTTINQESIHQVNSVTINNRLNNNVEICDWVGLFI